MKRYLLVLVVAACGDNVKTTPDASADATSDAPPMHAGHVLAKAVGHYLTETGEVTVPFLTVQLIDSGNAVVMPSVDPDGTLRFEPVAAGPYLICDTSYPTRTTCGQTAAPEIDLSFYSAGRPDATIGNASTSLALTTTSASAFTSAGEFLDIGALNTNLTFVGYPPATAPAPVVTNINFNGRGILASDDIVRVTQLSTKTSGSATYTAATKTGSVTGVTMTNGAAATATVDLNTALAQTPPASFEVKRSAFAALGGSAGPNATYAGFEIDGFAEKPPYQFFPWLFQYTTSSTATTDLPLSLSWGVSWPAATAQTFAVTFTYQNSVTAPGATSPTAVANYTSVYRPVAELTGDIAPKIGRVAALRVNDMDATVPRTATGKTPTIKWNAPTLGTPNRYTISVYRVIAQGTNSLAYSNAQFSVTGTELTIPPGFIQTGEAYLIGVRAESIAGFDPLKPFATVARYEVADTLSALMTP